MQVGLRWVLVLLLNLELEVDRSSNAVAAVGAESGKALAVVVAGVGAGGARVHVLAALAGGGIKVLVHHVGVVGDMGGLDVGGRGPGVLPGGGHRRGTFEG